MEPNLIEAARQVEHENRRKIRLAKLDEISKARNDLFFILAGEEVFKKSSKVSDYSSFEESMRQSIEKAAQHHRPEGPTTVPLPGDLLNQLRKLLSVDYTPPQDGIGMGVDLNKLAEYYRSNFFSSSIEMALDLSLCKLIRAVTKLYGVAEARGKTILTGRKKQKEIVNSKKSPVEEAYYHLNTKGKSLKKIGESVVDYLKSKGIEPPSVRTVIRYLTSNDKIRNNLIAEGAIKDKPTLVQ